LCYFVVHVNFLTKIVAGTDAEAILDNSFRVKGVKNLAVVDASVMPQLTRLNPALTVMMTGRYAGMLRPVAAE
jgi:choline oxidase